MTQTLQDLEDTLSVLQKRVTERKEAEIMAKGCHRCSGEIDSGNARREIALIGPCSVGSMSRTFILCYNCSLKISQWLDNREDI